jgi:hypothetical protein
MGCEKLGGVSLCLVLSLEGVWCQHVEGDVASLLVVKELEVLEHRVGELDPGPPAMPVE